MYHCYMHVYFTGHKCKEFEWMKEMPPLVHFSHEFSESDVPKKEMASVADVIFADMRGKDARETLQALLACKRQDAELILLVQKDQVSLIQDFLPEIADIWILPMSRDEAEFRFLRWQQNCKRNKDYWETSHFLEATINGTPNLIWYKDASGIHEKVNDSFCKTVNKPRDRVEGRDHYYIWDVDPVEAMDGADCAESDMEVIRKRETCVSEETIITGEGPRQLMTYKSPLYNLDGSVMGTVGVAIDVTQERAYEQEIVEKNHTLENIFTTLYCGVLCHTVDGARIVSVNEAALRILGYASERELKESGFALIAPSVMECDKGRLRESIRSLKNEGDSVGVEYRVQHKDGEILHVMGNIKLIKENGELLYQRFLLDCTAQKQQEEREKRRQAELVQALSIDYNLVCSFDLNTGMGLPLRIDDTHYKMFASDPGEEISIRESVERYIQEFVYEDDREILRQAFSQERMEKELAEKKLYYVNYRALVDGEMKYYEMKLVRAGRWNENQGVVLGFRSVDEETRKEMEQRSLLEDALFQANKASRAKSEFLSNMSHDIRTPMNAIVGFTNLAISHIDSRKQVDEYLQKIKMSGNHLLSLINDVLDMSRIESGRMCLDEKPCSLPDILCELHNMVQANAHAKRLSLQIDAIHVVDKEVYCDKLRLNQVLLNLLSNAVKYTPEGGSISFTLTEKGGAASGYANYEFCIRDNGIGMSEAFVARIFEPFEREKNTTISRIQGTGLGMAITKNIVDMMNGSIDIKSKKDVGTQVTISLMFRLHDGETIAPEPAPQMSVLPTGRILLVEDNELNQEIAVAILEDAGFETEVASNGQIAVDMLKKSNPGYYRLILMDVQMPVMDGYEATRRIRRLEEKALAEIPIIAMTANAFEEDRKETLKCGMRYEAV